ncbi:UNVERIFIED_CONTAM: G2/mitotic-specific cyclin-2 [Sesamum indicum]
MESTGDENVRRDALLKLKRASFCPTVLFFSICSHSMKVDPTRHRERGREEKKRGFSAFSRCVFSNTFESCSAAEQRLINGFLNNLDNGVSALFQGVFQRFFKITGFQRFFKVCFSNGFGCRSAAEQRKCGYRWWVRGEAASSGFSTGYKEFCAQLLANEQAAAAENNKAANANGAIVVGGALPEKRAAATTKPKPEEIIEISPDITEVAELKEKAGEKWMKKKAGSYFASHCYSARLHPKMQIVVIDAADVNNDLAVVEYVDEICQLRYKLLMLLILVQI